MQLPHLHSLKKVRLKSTRQVLPQVASSESLLFSCCPAEGSSMRDFRSSTSTISPRETSINGEAIWCSDTFCCVKHVFPQEVSACGYCWVLCIENAQPNATETWCLLTTFVWALSTTTAGCAYRDSTNRPGHMIETILHKTMGNSFWIKTNFRCAHCLGTGHCRKTTGWCFLDIASKFSGNEI